MKNILFILLFLISSFANAADLGFLGQLGDVKKIMNGFPYGTGSICSDCGNSGFEVPSCPTHASRMISDHIKYGGILGWSNSEKDFKRCFSRVYQADELKMKRFTGMSKSYFYLSSFPGEHDFKECFESFSLNKTRRLKQEKILVAMNFLEVYKGSCISHFREELKEKFKSIDRQGNSASKESKKEREKYYDLYVDVMDMESCFRSGNNCFGASRTLDKVPRYKVDVLINASRLPADKHEIFKKYLGAAYCIDQQ